jgi:hypothetical protein
LCDIIVGGQVTPDGFCGERVCYPIDHLHGVEGEPIGFSVFADNHLPFAGTTPFSQGLEIQVLVAFCITFTTILIRRIDEPGGFHVLQIFIGSMDNVPVLDLMEMGESPLFESPVLLFSELGNSPSSITSCSGTKESSQVESLFAIKHLLGNPVAFLQDREPEDVLSTTLLEPFPYSNNLLILVDKGDVMIPVK